MGVESRVMQTMRLAVAQDVEQHGRAPRGTHGVGGVGERARRCEEGHAPVTEVLSRVESSAYVEKKKRRGEATGGQV